MKPTEIVAALAAYSAEQVSTLVSAAISTREAREALAAFEPVKKRRGRKPDVPNKVKAKPASEKAPVKKAGKLAAKAIPETF